VSRARNINVFVAARGSLQRSFRPPASYLRSPLRGGKAIAEWRGRKGRGREGRTLKGERGRKKGEEDGGGIFSRTKIHAGADHSVAANFVQSA